MEYLSIYLCLLQFLSSMSYSFQEKKHLPEETDPKITVNTDVKDLTACVSYCFMVSGLNLSL